jgi:hypothetical protein
VASSLALVARTGKKKGGTVKVTIVNDTKKASEKK